MDAAMMIAQVFGPFMAIMGLWMLLYGDNVVKIMNSIKGSPAAQYYSALVNLFIGVFILNHYNVWMWNIQFFVTLLGWVTFIRGVLGLFIPQLVVKWTMSNTSWMKTMGIIPFVWGLLLIWTGFYM